MNFERSIAPRRSWLDLCRVFSIFFVIVIHACGSSFYQFGKIDLIDWLASNLLDSFVRCAVPLFVMVSGALLLENDKILVTPLIIVKRVAKVLIPLIFWNAAFLEYVSYYSGQSINWFSMFYQPPMYHLWFVYMIIGIYIFLPVFQSIFRSIRERSDLQVYLFLLWIVLTCLPIYQSNPIFGLLQQTSFLGYGGYFVIGGIIASKEMLKFRTSIWLLIYLLSVAITFILTWNSSVHAEAVVETAYLYFSANVIVASIALFLVFSKINCDRFWSSVFHWISERCFLIFFMHVVILERVGNFIGSFNLHVPIFLSILITATLTFCICLILASLLRLIPKSRLIFG